MKISFTGTRQGMTEEQKKSFSNLLNVLTGFCLIHGDCVGADADAHNIAKENGLKINIRPCILEGLRAHCVGSEVVAEPEKPLDRNCKIVNDGDILIAVQPPCLKLNVAGHGIQFVMPETTKNLI